MEHQTLIIPSKIDAAVFRRFALFDTFYVQGFWKKPALFAAVFAASAAVCFAMRGRREGAVLLGTVLLTVGLGLPAAYVLNFLLSVRKQGKLLDGSKTAYTLHLREEGLLVLTGRERAEFPWKQVHCVYRTESCIYLYVSPRQAFLLPEEKRSEEAWTLLRERLPAEKLTDRRRH